MLRKLWRWLIGSNTHNSLSLDLIRVGSKELLTAVECYAEQCAATEKWQQLHELQALCCWLAKHVKLASGVDDDHRADEVRDENGPSGAD